MAAPEFNEDADYSEPTRKFHPLSEGEKKSILQREIEDALGGLGSQVAEDRRIALRYYNGREFGNEIEGRSRVILTDVADTVDWIMPSLMRMFTGGRLVVRYVARRPEDEEMAEQATEYINMLFRSRLNGFEILWDWFKTALIEKNGIVKPWVDERYEPTKTTYRGLSEAELNVLLADPGNELIAMTPYTKETAVNGEMVAIECYDATVRREEPRVEIKVDSIPPEEFLIARRTINLDDYVPFAAHRVKRTVSDLIAMGVPPDVASTLPSDDTPEYSQGRTERLSEDETFPVTTAERADPASREVWVTECYIRMDSDGDGFAELRKVVVVGEQSVTILFDEEINWQPFCSLTPNPMPHKFFGLSVADQVADLQLIRSTLLRQMLDNLYITNNTRYEVVEGAVELDDILSSVPGGIVRVTQQGAVTPLQSDQFGPMPMHMMEFLEGVRETRTGVSKWQQGPDASSLTNQTHGAVSQVMQASYAKIETIARIFAETGVRHLFQKLLKLMSEGGVKEDVMRMRGKWVDIDPTKWATDMDVEVQVGLGVGQSQERIMHLMNVLMMQRDAVERGLRDHVKPQHVFKTTEMLTEAMNLPGREVFFSDPGDADWPEPAPDPKVLEHKRRTKDDQNRIELDAQKHGLDITDKLQTHEERQRQMEIDREMRKYEIDTRAELEREKMKSQEKIAAMQSQASKENSDG